MPRPLASLGSGTPLRSLQRFLREERRVLGGVVVVSVGAGVEEALAGWAERGVVLLKRDGMLVWVCGNWLVGWYILEIGLCVDVVDALLALD